MWLSNPISLYITSHVKQDVSVTSMFLEVYISMYITEAMSLSILCCQVWVSSVTEIRPEDLRAQDLDTPPEELYFMVTPPSNGHLALKSAPMKAVLNFTQSHIDQGQLLFVHKGKNLFFYHLMKDRHRTTLEKPGDTFFNNKSQKCLLFDLIFILHLDKQHKNRQQK